MYGITATPFRKHTDEKALYIYLGEIIAEIAPLPIEKNRLPSVVIRNTSLNVPYDATIDSFENLTKILIHDTVRNKLILSDIEKETTSGRKLAILTERKEHIVTLNLYLQKDFQVITLSGDDKEKERIHKWERINNNEFDIIITTGQLFGEGTDLKSIESLFLVYPFSYEGKLIQYIGRVMRAEIAPVIYDYRDEQIPHLEKLFQKRNSYYRKLYRKGQLNPQQELHILFDNDAFYINHSVTAFPLHTMELPEVIEEIKPGVSWLIRILKFDENTGLLFAEILDYHHSVGRIENQEIQDYISLTKIRFRTTDTAKLLQVAVLKKVQRNRLKAKIIEDIIKIPFDLLEFQYCIASFKHFIHQIDIEVIFEIDNSFIRPEFEVLKPYFSKVLKMKKLPIQIKVEYSETEILSKSAICLDLEKINQEIIDSVKFQFTTHHIIRKKERVPTQSTFTLSELEEKHPSVYQSEDEFLQYALKLKNVKHARQLRFLAQKHKLDIMKIRFVLEPFSFVFLLSGKYYYYIVWETLHTEEATYIWHIHKETTNFFDVIEKIDQAIQLVKISGRQQYLESSPIDFSRVIHDYQDEKKGFIKWRDALDRLLH